MLDQTLPSATFERLRQVFAGMATSLAHPVILLTEAEFPAPYGQAIQYSLCISPQFSACLQGTMLAQGDYQAQITCDPSSIATVLQSLQASCAAQPPDRLVHAQVWHRLEENQSDLQNQFITQVLQIIATALADGDSSPTAVACQPMVDAALSQQVAQERLVHQVTAQIRQSLDLKVILETAVEQVRAFLQVDRLVIYQFTETEVDDQTVTFDATPTQVQHNQGWIAYEACSSSNISSVLDYQEQYCWDEAQGCRVKYDQGVTLAVDDIEQSYTSSDCLLNFLRTIDVRAKMIAPIIVQSRLWGLLIAHQCFVPRVWQHHEKELLHHIAEQLEIAIYQAQLYQQLQQQKATLEQQVHQRTQQLQTALLEAQSANRAKSDFLSTMSHELRTPLTYVIGMSATLLRWSLGPLTDKQRNYLQQIHDSGEHLLELINDILDFSHVASGKATLNLSEFSLISMAQQSLHLHRNQSETQGVKLILKSKGLTEEDRFVADARRVKQILFILLDNAIKFTPAGGEVTLRVWLEDQTAVFQVKDTGIGISPSQQTQLFQQFQQLDTSYRRIYQGTGLGLAMAKQFVDLHHGWIGVTSAEGEGSIFTVELPHQTLSTLVNAVVETDVSGTEAPNPRVILIEPREDSASLMCDMLTAAGYQVIWTVDVATAITQMRRWQPEIVITGLSFFDPSQQRLLDAIGQSSQLYRTKIVALIDGDDAHHAQNQLMAGIDAYLTRPIDPHHLVHKIDLLLPHGAIAVNAATETQVP